MAGTEVINKLREAAEALAGGAYVEDVIEVVRSVAYDLARGLLRGGVEEGASLTEMSYMLKERGFIDEETHEFLRELDRMLEMAHYDIWSMYTRGELVRRIKKLEELAMSI